MTFGGLLLYGEVMLCYLIRMCPWEIILYLILCTSIGVVVLMIEVSAPSDISEKKSGWQAMAQRNVLQHPKSVRSKVAEPYITRGLLHACMADKPIT
jgi:hypothetical protein